MKNRNYRPGFVISLVLALACIIASVTFYTQLSSTKSSLALTESDLNTTKTELTTSQNNLNTTQGQLLTTQNDLSSTKSNLATTQNQLTTTQSQLSSTQNDLSATKTNLTTTQNQLATTQNSLAATQKDLTAAQAQATTLQTSLTTAQTQAATLQTSLTAEQTQAATLQTSLTATNSQVTALQSQLSSGHILGDTTYAAMLTFLASDKTDLNTYNVNTYNCVNFSADVIANAAKQYIRCALISIDMNNADAGHDIVAFNTTDKGMVYIEPQNDCIVNLKVGGRYYQEEVPPSGYHINPPSYDDTVSRFVVIW